MLRLEIFNLKIAVKFFLILFIAASCSTSKKLSTYEIKPLSASKIIRKVEKETPLYKSYESKKVNIDFETDELKTSISGQIALVKNDRILLTLRKLSIPVAKGLITRDSVKMINYLERYYVDDNLSTIQKLFKLDVDFELLQALLTADVSNLLNNEELDKELTSYIDSQMYRIDSQFDEKIDKALTKGNEKKLNKYMAKMDDSEFIDYSVWIDPQYFVIRKVTFNNIKRKESITLNYNQFELVGRSLFPQHIILEHHSPNNNLKLDLKLSKPTINDVKEIGFVLPEKYDKLNLNK